MEHTQGRLRASTNVGANLRSYSQSAAITSEDVSSFGGTQLVAGCFGDVLGGEAQAAANARRLVACWNACEGVPTELLELHGAKMIPPELPYAALEAQRDELLAELEALATWASTKTTDGVHRGHHIGKARALIAKHKEASHG